MTVFGANCPKGKSRGLSSDCIHGQLYHFNKIQQLGARRTVNLRINMRTFWNSGAAVACVFALLLACFPDASTSLELSLNERTRNTLRVRCENLGAVVAGASLQLNTTTPPADCFSVTHTDSNGYMTLNFTTSCEGTLLDNCLL